MNKHAVIFPTMPFALSGIFCLLTLCAFTQQTNFSADWRLKDQQSISGKLYANGVPETIHVTQSSKLIIVRKTTATGDGKEVTATDTLSFDEKPFSSLSSMGNQKQTTLLWNADRSGFTTVAIVHNAADISKNDFTTTDTWSVENDQLVLRRKVENFTNGEVWESKAIYQKQ